MNPEISQPNEENIALNTPEIKERPGKTVVEIGPGGNNPFRAHLRPEGREAKFRAGENSETLFTLEPGDTIIEIDLPIRKSADAAKQNIDDFIANRSHLNSVKNKLEKYFVPEGINVELVHADAQKLPFVDEQIDVVFMAEVLAGHIRNQKFGEKVHSGRALREKQNIIKDIKRVLKKGGKLIIQEESAPAEGVNIIYDKVIDDLSKDTGFQVKTLATWEKDGEFMVELTKL
jgi:SAM-dependent methyltransferase